MRRRLSGRQSRRPSNEGRRASRVSQGSERDLRQHGGSFAPSSHNICTAFFFLPSPYPTSTAARPQARRAGRALAPPGLGRGPPPRPRGRTPVAAAEGGGAAAGLSRGPAQPRPAHPPALLGSRALSCRAPPPAPRALCPARPPRSPAGKGCVGSRQGEAPPASGRAFLGTPGPATKAPFRGPSGTRESGVRQRLPTPALSRPPCSSFPPRFLLLSRPRGSHTPRAEGAALQGRTKKQAGRKGAAAGTARSQEGSESQAVDPTPLGGRRGLGAEGSGQRGQGQGACPSPPPHPQDRRGHVCL